MGQIDNRNGFIITLTKFNIKVAHRDSHRKVWKGPLSNSIIVALTIMYTALDGRK